MWCSAGETAICRNAAGKTGCIGLIERQYVSLKHGLQIWPQHYIHTYYRVYTKACILWGGMQ
jgi:hypothetical protein